MLSALNLKGKRAIVTGPNRNIGRAIALVYAAEGADLVLNRAVGRRDKRP